MRKLLLRLAAVMGITAVMLGAFGAHALKNYVSLENVNTFETGVRYHLLHAIMIGMIGVLSHFGRKKSLYYAAWFFTGGIILFSGSIYLLSIREIVDFGSWLGPITPIGGTLFIAGWALLFVSTYHSFDRSQKPA